MISTTDFRGGAEFQTTAGGSIVLYRNSRRVQQVQNTSGTAASISIDGINWAQHQLGGPHFYIVNDPASVGLLNVGYKAAVTGVATTLALSPGEVAVCFGVESSSWFVKKRVIGTPRTAGHGTRGSIVNPAKVLTYTPYCLEGDGCEVADSSGNVPLDGRAGRPLCIAPMYQNSALVAKNSTREPVRGADLVMPSSIPIKFSRGDFVVDSLHPKFGSFPLGDEFLNSLYANDRWHAVPYLGSFPGVSAHWHHIRREGTSDFLPLSWGLPAAKTVRRHIWEKVVNYRDAGDTVRHTTIRFVMEHTVFPEPLLAPDGTGGKNDEDEMAWGAIFMIYVFTDEVEPTFADGDTYRPAGCPSNKAFTKDNPVHWGFWDGEGQDEKYCHPQLAICASLPTTFESPAGSLYVPYQQRKWLRKFPYYEFGFTLRGLNRAACYEVSNGAPWLIGGCAAEPLGGVGIENNIVFGGALDFGVSATSFSYAAMSTGGDIPRSKPTEYVLMENGEGVGRTLLRPLRPGWDEACGVLDPATGSGMQIRICVDDKYGLDDGTGRRFWPRYEVDPCQGHVDEPLNGVGGSHYCFHNNGNSCGTWCCIKLTEQAAGVVDMCVTDNVGTGDFNGVDCDIRKVECNVSGTYEQQIIMEIEDYDYVWRANQDIRVATWRRDFQDPSQVTYDNTYTAADTEWEDQIGTWAHAANLSVTVSGVARSFLFYKPAAYTAKYRDMRITARALKAKTAPHGLLVRANFASTLLTGYSAVIAHTSGNNGIVSIHRLTGVGTVLLATVNISNLTSETVDLDLEIWGTDITFKWQVLGHAEEELTAQDCVNEERGYPGVICPLVSTAVEFEPPVVDDTTVEYVVATGFITKSSIQLYFPLKARPWWNTCDASFGDLTICNSEIFDQTLHYNENAAWAHCRDVLLKSGCEGSPYITGDNPTFYGGDDPYCCEGPWCQPGDGPRCTQCPPPHATMFFNFWQRCMPTEPVPLPEPIICAGITLWDAHEIACL